MSLIPSLFVLWSDQHTRRRWIIGRLSRTEDGQFEFRYEEEARMAAEEGFRALPEFPDIRARYVSPYLFSTFSQRIPSPGRRDYPNLLRKWGVHEAVDALEVLARSAGIQMTDRLELAEYRSEDDPLERPLEFRIAGRRYAASAVDLSEGTLVRLEREPTNEYDPCATLVLVHDGTKVGYVPRQYSALIARHLDAGHELRCHVVRRLQVPEGRDGAIVRVERAMAGSLFRDELAEHSAA